MKVVKVGDWKITKDLPDSSGRHYYRLYQRNVDEFLNVYWTQYETGEVNGNKFNVPGILMHHIYENAK